MKIRKSNGEMSCYIPGAIVCKEYAEFTLNEEIQEDFKGDPNIEFIYPTDKPAFCRFTFPVSAP